MRGLVLALVLGASGLSGCIHINASMSFDATPQSDEMAIRNVLDVQSDAWNRGDIPAFMEGYWQSDELRFASGGNITYGWTETRDRYLARYDSPAKMGVLSFTDLIIEQTDSDDALVFGHWALQREADRPSGLFTLHFHKFGDDWKIVSDHTSSAD